MIWSYNEDGKGNNTKDNDGVELRRGKTTREAKKEVGGADNRKCANEEFEEYDETSRNFPNKFNRTGHSGFTRTNMNGVANRGMNKTNNFLFNHPDNSDSSDAEQNVKTPKLDIPPYHILLAHSVLKTIIFVLNQTLRGYLTTCPAVFGNATNNCVLSIKSYLLGSATTQHAQHRRSNTSTRQHTERQTKLRDCVPKGAHHQAALKSVEPRKSVFQRGRRKNFFYIIIFFVLFIVFSQTMLALLIPSDSCHIKPKKRWGYCSLVYAKAKSSLEASHLHSIRFSEKYSHISSIIYKIGRRVIKSETIEGQGVGPIPRNVSHDSTKHLVPLYQSRRGRIQRTQK
uniref:Uncharacterized protein n=1 Tax=Timema tahoe TaxID=61484 RepID=A0A7R9IPF0_9NEOP|nr:unnamed protein product [Timema tahoe]